MYIFATPHSKCTGESHVIDRFDRRWTLVSIIFLCNRGTLTSHIHTHTHTYKRTWTSRKIAETFASWEKLLVQIYDLIKRIIEISLIASVCLLCMVSFFACSSHREDCVINMEKEELINEEDNLEIEIEVVGDHNCLHIRWNIHYWKLW